MQRLLPNAHTQPGAGKVRARPPGRAVRFSVVRSRAAASGRRSPRGGDGGDGGGQGRPAAVRMPLSPTWAPTTQVSPASLRHSRDPQARRAPAALGDADVEGVQARRRASSRASATVQSDSSTTTSSGSRGAQAAQAGQVGRRRPAARRRDAERPHRRDRRQRLVRAPGAVGVCPQIDIWPRAAGAASAQRAQVGRPDRRRP